jgi:hypothetical protein
LNQEEYNAQVEARALKILEAVLERGAHQSLWGAHALMTLAPDGDRVVEIVRRHLWKGSPGPVQEQMGGPFEVLPCMLLLRRWEEQLPQEAVGLIREFMTRAHLERGNTENHWLMYYAGNLLAAERWPDLERTWNGLPPLAIREEASRWILGMIGRTALGGHHEYDSTGYHVEHMVSYIGLFDHAQDEHLRAQVGKMLSLLVADMALEYFHGAWAGGHSREGYRQNTWTLIGGVLPLQHLYFGGEFDPLLHTQGFAVPALVSGYRPPVLFAEMAQARSEPHAVKKTRAPRTIYRHADQDARPVRKYTWMSRSFALGSTQLGLPGTQAGPIDLVSWDLSWRGARHQAKIVGNHPYRGAGRFSAFLPGFPQHIGRLIGTDKPYLQRPDRLFGASPFERLLQHQGTLLALYKIPEDDEAPFVNLYLPKSPSWVEREGWIAADLGGFYTGLYLIGPYEWMEIREASSDSTLVLDGDLIDGWLLRIYSRRPGLVLEAVEADEAGDFEEFCRRRAELRPDLSGWPEPGRAVVETITGHVLELMYDGEHRVDGERIDYDLYPLYETPSVEAPLGTGRMVFQRGTQKVELDFGIDPQKERLPMRVIG